MDAVDVLLSQSVLKPGFQKNYKVPVNEKSSKIIKRNKQMDTQCGWIIVVFSEDNSAEVVPYSWLNKEGTCAWPEAKQAKKIIEKKG